MQIGEIPRGFQLALDLVNTIRVEDGRPADGLAGPGDLRGWLREHGWPSGVTDRLAASPAEAALLLQEAGRLREAVGRALEAFATAAPVPEDALFAIDRVLASSRVVRRLDGGGPAPRLREEETESQVLAVLAPLALGAAELLTGADAERVRRCASERCLEWFVDTSKGGRRRWCSMERCGNRAKAARHRRRRKVG